MAFLLLQIKTLNLSLILYRSSPTASKHVHQGDLFVVIQTLKQAYFSRFKLLKTIINFWFLKKTNKMMHFLKKLNLKEKSKIHKVIKATLTNI